MRSPSACERLLTLAALIAAACAHEHTALADEKAICSDAYTATQVARRAGKLEEAAKEGATCARPVCAKFVRDDCSRWVSEIATEQPSVILAGADERGAPVAITRVMVDGAEWQLSPDAPHAIDPGSHQLHCEGVSVDPVDLSIEIHRGEQHKRVEIVFHAPEPLPPQEPPPTPPSHRPPNQPPPPLPPPVQVASPAPWIIGGLGLAWLIAASITGGLTLHAKSVVEQHCSDVSRTCDKEGVEAEKSGRILGPVTTVGLVVGGLGVATGSVMLVVRAVQTPPASKAAIVLQRFDAPDGAALVFESHF